jgi:2,5-diamino-6-(ribosylamino)-4(3H)-pyrimidinone 5'-phosphate reductase
MTSIRPRLILHNAISLDGKLDGFEVDLGLYYEVAARLGAQAMLSGSNTILAGFAEAADSEGTSEDSAPPLVPEADGRPLLVVVDSRGRIQMWERIRRQRYWRGLIGLCSERTPAASLEALRRSGAEAIIAGKRRVDLAAGLSALAERYGVGTVRVDSGGRLNAALLRAGLVDEISVLVHPLVVGSGSRLPLVASISAAPSAPAKLENTLVQTERGGVLWMRYRVVRDELGVAGPPTTVEPS